MSSFSEMKTLVLCCISILLVLEVVYINMSGFFDFKDLVGKDRSEQFNAWFYNASDKEKIIPGNSFFHRTNFGSIEVRVEETSLDFVLNNNNGKGIWLNMIRTIKFKHQDFLQH